MNKHLQYETDSYQGLDCKENTNTAFHHSSVLKSSIPNPNLSTEGSNITCIIPVNSRLTDHTYYRREHIPSIITENTGHPSNITTLD